MVTITHRRAKNNPKPESQPGFYLYRQNNSGGHHYKDDAVCEFVIVEANGNDDADRRAENIGIYFDGVDLNRDDDDWGDRWHRADSYDVSPEPMLFEQNPLMEGFVFPKYAKGNDYKGVFCRIYYKDGRITDISNGESP
jgi:hypothetical protein